MGIVHLYSENTGADQLHGNCAADVRLCFCICEKQVFSCHGSFNILHVLPSKRQPGLIKLNDIAPLC